MNVEKLLGIAADSQKMGDWGDTLSFMVNASKGGTIVELNDDDLMQVAGGIGQEIVLNNKKKDNL